MKWRLLFVVALSLGFATDALTHPDWALARIKPPNGGQLRNAGTFHLELVVSNEAIRLYVTDHFFNKFPTKNCTATAVIVTGEHFYKVALTPAGENLLHASGDFVVGPDTRVGILLEANRYGQQVARFTPLRNLADLVPEAKPMDAEPGSSKDIQ